MKLLKYLPLSLMLVCACDSAKDPAVARAFRERVKALRSDVLRLSEGVKTPASAGYVTFVSVCDGTRRACVRAGVGSTPEAAWKRAVDGVAREAGASWSRAKWIRADVVIAAESGDDVMLAGLIGGSDKFELRKGISFDAEYRTAILEGELNAEELLDYKNGALKKRNVCRFLKVARGVDLQALPEKMTFFSCRSVFLDETGKVFELSGDESSFGRRRMAKIDGELLRRQCAFSVDYLLRQVKEDGSFVYGYKAGSGKKLKSYNILRHAGTLWELSKAYGRTGDAAVGEAARRAAAYLVKNVKARDDRTAYVLEEKNGELKLGGCGLAVIALTSYMQAFKTNEYAAVCGRLGNGILTMWDAQEKSWIHVLSSKTFKPVAKFRTVYYDGEATFALCCLYELTGERKWLDAARASIDMFVAKDYVKYRDQWVAYALNSFTKHVQETKYLDFAVRNLQENLGKIAANTALAPVCLELLMQGYEVVLRQRAAGIEPKGFDERTFRDTVRARLEAMENNWTFPETAMFMERPDDVVNVFADRRAGFRVRIDDVQHCLGGFAACAALAKDFGPNFGPLQD